MNKGLEKAYNEHITQEFFSAYLYLSMAAYFQRISLPGFANWMHIQYREEMDHGLKFYKHLLDRSGTIELGAIQAPPSNWESPTHVFQDTLAHEQLMSKRIYALVDLAVSNRDHASNQFLQWFVSEQVEEEATVNTILDQLKMLDGSKEGLFLLDRELGSRQYSSPEK